MTVGDVVALVRDILSDTYEPYRYDDEQVLRALNTGLLQMRRLRPDLFQSLKYVTPSYTTADMGETIPLETFYVPSLAEYSAGYIELADDEFAVDGRAVSLLNRFTTQLTRTV